MFRYLKSSTQNFGSTIKIWYDLTKNPYLKKMKICFEDFELLFRELTR